MDQSLPDTTNEENELLLPTVIEVLREETYYKSVWLKNPSNVLAERDDSVVKALCYGP